MGSPEREPCSSLSNPERDICEYHEMVQVHRGDVSVDRRCHGGIERSSKAEKGYEEQRGSKL